jgi:hypothetical protein
MNESLAKALPVFVTVDELFGHRRTAGAVGQ